MLLEGLVLYSCLLGDGCSTTSKAYYLANPQVQQQISLLERQAVETIGERTVAMTAPMISIAIQKQGVFRINRYFGFEFSIKEIGSEYVGLRVDIDL